ncbi:hypothetical protein [Kitasatospora phosalacinea]|uniref:hypothetical protein n=1 Tax=Kitasatospora phosalacinea TaxID=2065 RepID=UPI000691441B|nr:hypothetical protein [Kitasatospora phosalacinea]
MRELAEFAFAAVCCLWIVLTVVCQVPSRAAGRIRGRDVFALVPQWSFFAPTPGMQDIVVVHRYRTVDGGLSRWREVAAGAPSGQPLCAVWNPHRRHAKAVLDATKNLMQLAAEGRRPEEIQLSVPYLALLTYVSAQLCPQERRATQFALVVQRSSAFQDPPSVAFVSALHAID